MRFVSVRDLRGRSKEVWEKLKEEGEIVITSNGRPVAIMTAADDSNLEEILSAFRRARAIEAVATLQRRSVAEGTNAISREEIEQEIRAVRDRRDR